MCIVSFLQGVFKGASLDTPFFYLQKKSFHPNRGGNPRKALSGCQEHRRRFYGFPSDAHGVSPILFLCRLSRFT